MALESSLRPSVADAPGLLPPLASPAAPLSPLPLALPGMAPLCWRLRSWVAWPCCPTASASSCVSPTTRCRRPMTRDRQDGGRAWRWSLFRLPNCAGALLLLLPLTELACMLINAPASASSSPPCPSTAALQVHTALNYHIRVVVPCYKEPLDVIQKTVTAALVAPIPTNCSRTGA